MRVKDINGAVVSGLVRGENMGLAVDNRGAYERYLQEKERVEKINSLEQQVNYLTSLVESLVRNKQ